MAKHVRLHKLHDTSTYGIADRAKILGEHVKRVSVHVNRMRMDTREVRLWHAGAVVVFELEVDKHRPSIRENENVGFIEFQLTTGENIAQ